MSNKIKNLYEDLEQSGANKYQAPENKFKKPATLILFGISLVSILFGVILSVIPPKENQRVEREIATSETISQKNNQDSTNYLIETPIDLPSWGRMHYTTLKQSDYQDVVNSENTSFIKNSSVANSLPSEENGFTSDLNMKTLDDGKVNNKFTIMTEESFVLQANFIVNRIVNPVFGGWAEITKPTSFNIYVLSANNGFWGIATDKFLESVAIGKSKILFADYNQNHYGELLRKYDYYSNIIGVVKNGNVEYDPINKVYTMVFNVDYTTVGNKVIKSQKVKLNMIVDDYGYLLIDSANAQDL